MTTSTYALHRELSTPTAVEYTATAHFTSPDDTNLILAKRHILELFTLTAPPSHPSSHASPPPHLERVGHFPLFGCVQSLAVVRIPGYTRDSLLVSFGDCRLSLLHYSPSTRDLVTLDTSHFEQLRDQTTASAHQTLTPTLPLLRVDPLTRCAVLLAYHHALLVFPLHDHNPHIEHSDLALTAYVYGGPSGILRPYTIPLAHPAFAPPKDATAGMTDLVDFAFLSGYNQPTLLLLHRHPHTWEGRYAAHRHTSQLLTITLDLGGQGFLVLARTQLHLPYDTHALVPLPAPHGGCLVFSAQLIFHFSNQHIDYSLATNAYGDYDTKFHSEQSLVVVNMQLAASTILYSSPASIQLLVATRDGQLLLMTVDTAGTGVRQMQLRKLATAVPFSALSTLYRRATSLFVFLGSRVGSSLLVEMRERSEDEMRAELREQQRQEDERNREREERDKAEKERIRMLREASVDGSIDAEQIKAEAEVQEELDDIFGISISSGREREAQRREERARAKEETSRQYELVVRDAMVGVAPCVDFVLSAEEGRGKLVGISGQGPQGAISIQCEGVVPTEITKFALDQRCTGCWTVRAQERRSRRPLKRKREEAAPESQSAPAYDTDLFISGALATTHLRTAEEITQVDAASSYLRTDVSSLLVGNVCGWLGVVQVWQDGLRLVWRGERTVERSVDQLLHPSPPASLKLEQDGDAMMDERKEVNGSFAPAHIVRSKLCDPYVALQFSDGRLSVLRLDEIERKEEKADDSEPFTLSTLSATLPALPGVPSSPPISAVAIYRDAGVSALFALPSVSAVVDATSGKFMKDEVQDARMDEEKQPPSNEEEVDELEMLLGGGDQPTVKAGAAKDAAEAGKGDIGTRGPSTEAVYVCVVCRGHYLELYSLPTFTLLFRTPRFTAGRRTLTHSGEELSVDSHVQVVADADLPIVTDVALHSVSGLPSAAPVLCAYTGGHELLLYLAFAYTPSGVASSAALRFIRFQHALLTRPVVARTTRPSTSAVLPWLYGDRFVSFESLSGHPCILLTGYRPLILFGERGHVRLHDLTVEASDAADEEKELEHPTSDLSTSEERRERLRSGIACAVPFHNAQCDHGCVLIDIAGFVRICELAPAAPLPTFSASASGAAPTLASRDALMYTHYDHPLPVRVHPLPSTPRFLCYHAATNSFPLVLSRPKPIQSMEEPTPRSVTLTEESYELLLLSPPSSPAPFSIIGRFDDFDPHEVVLCLAPVALNDRTFIAMGTATQLGEETSVKGRILLLDAYAAASSTTATPLLKLRVFAQAEKGPVTAMAFVGNLLAVGVGMKLMLYEFDGKALIGRAFLDVPHYVVNVRVIKYYLLIADLFRHLILAGWDPITKQLIVLGKHADGMELTAVDLLIEQRQLTLVAADMAGNVQLLRWQPKTLPPPPPPPAQITGSSTLPLVAFFAAAYSQRLTVKADFHTATAVTRMEKYRLRLREQRLPLTQLARGKSGTGGGASGGVSTAPTEAELSGRQLEQQQSQPFNLTTQTPSLSTSAVLPTVTTPIRSALLLSSMAGQYAVLQPLDELVYRRLHSLTSQLHLHVPQYAALNARAFRSVSLRGGRLAGKKSVVDGQLLRVFLGLTRDEQAALAKTIGMQIEQIVDIIHQLENQSTLR